MICPLSLLRDDACLQLCVCVCFSTSTMVSVCTKFTVVEAPRYQH
jgi:hypothetical protein